MEESKVKKQLVFWDITQSEYWFEQLFGLELQLPITKDTRNQFILKAPIIVFITALFGFVILEHFPPILGMFLLLILLYISIILLVIYFSFVNRLSKRFSLVGLLICIIPLMIILLII
jgi:hypothetical protein